MTGKLDLYDKGFIYSDIRQGAFFVPFADLKGLNFYMDEISHESNKNVWVQFDLNSTERIPCGQIIDKNNQSFYLFLPYAFLKDNYARFADSFDETND